MAKMKFKGTINGRTYSDEVVFQCALQKAISSGEPVNAHIESVEDNTTDPSVALFDTSSVFTDSERLGRDEFDNAADKAFQAYREWLGLHIGNETFDRAALKEAVINEGNRVNSIISNLKIQRDDVDSKLYRTENEIKNVVQEINRLKGVQTQLESKKKQLSTEREVINSRTRAFSKLLDVYLYAVTTINDTASGQVNPDNIKPTVTTVAAQKSSGSEVIDDLRKWLEEL